MLCAMAAGCGQADPTGTYEAYTTFMAYGSADPEARAGCELPLGVAAANANIVVGHDTGYFLEFQGCRIRAVFEDGVLSAEDEQCEPLNPALESLRPRVYEHLEFDTVLGTLWAISASLGPTGEGRCNQVDGQVRKVGSKGANAWMSTIWAFDAVSEALSEDPQHRIQGPVTGYLVEQPDGSVFAMGLTCTLPGRTATGEVVSLDAAACPSRFAGDHRVPRFQPNSYTLTDTEFTLRGEFGEGDSSFTYELSSTSLDHDPR